MSDQMVIDFIDVVNVNAFKSPVVGNRYLILDAGIIKFTEFDGHSWNTTLIDKNTVITVYLIERNKSVYIFGNNLHPCESTFLCECCAKIYGNLRKINNLCEYCHFQKIYDSPNWKELDGNPKTIGKHISDGLNISKLRKTDYPITDNCFISDYRKKDIVFLDIKSAHLIYSIDILKKFQQKKIDIII